MSLLLSPVSIQLMHAMFCSLFNIEHLSIILLKKKKEDKKDAAILFTLKFSEVHSLASIIKFLFARNLIESKRMTSSLKKKFH